MMPPRSASASRAASSAASTSTATCRIMPVQRWGRAWLERGTGEARFGKPVYEGDIAEVTATEDADGLALSVHSEGRALRDRPRRIAGGAPRCRRLVDYKAVAAARRTRPRPTNSHCAVGDWLGMNPLTVTRGILMRRTLQDTAGDRSDLARSRSSIPARSCGAATGC